MHIWLTTPTSVAVGSPKIAPMSLACQQASYRRVTGSRGLCVGNRQEAYIADSAGVLSPGHKTVIGSKPGSFHRLPSSHDTNPERHARFRQGVATQVIQQAGRRDGDADPGRSTIYGRIRSAEPTSGGRLRGRLQRGRQTARRNAGKRVFRPLDAGRKPSTRQAFRRVAKSAAALFGANRGFR